MCGSEILLDARVNARLSEGRALAQYATLDAVFADVRENPAKEFHFALYIY